MVPVRDLNRAPLGDCGDASCAGAIYDEGIALRGTDPVRAHALLKKAADKDGIPLRVRTSAQDYLRTKEGKGIFVIDAPNLLAQQNGLLDSSLFQDHVHLSAQGHIKMGVILSNSISKQLEQR